jgi:hypothetical protein
MMERVCYWERPPRVYHLTGVCAAVPAQPLCEDIGQVGAMVSFKEGHELLHELAGSRDDQ